MAVTPLTPVPLELVKKPAMPLLARPRRAVPVPFCWTYRAVSVPAVESLVPVVPELLVWLPRMSGSPEAACVVSGADRKSVV